jgi:dTDP-4-dehydrorhamnose reductase
MRVAVVGAGGQLGRALRRRLGARCVPLTHAEIEITDDASVRAALGRVRPEAVVNAAAYNLVDRGELEPDVAYAVNALGPRSLAAYCASAAVPLVHVSTDYVFGRDENRAEPYAEPDAPGPLSAYGVSKLAGEQFVLAASPRHAVLRTCGLYGPVPTPGRGNFVETMLRLAEERDELTVVDDQRCTPTNVDDLAAAVEAVLGTGAGGLFHATNAGETTWCDFARAILEAAGKTTPVRAITSAQFAAPARRPAYSVLNCDRLADATGFRFPPWHDALKRYLHGRGV